MTKNKRPWLPWPWAGRGMVMLQCCPCCKRTCPGVHYRDCKLGHRQGQYMPYKSSW